MRIHSLGNLAFALIFASVSATAAPTLRCFTEKHEVDPSAPMFPVATDSNQTIELAIDAAGQPKGSTVLQFEFSQSSGGKSAWSLEIKSGRIAGDRVSLQSVLRRDGKPFYTQTLELVMQPLGESGAAHSEVALLNEKISPVAGKTVFYNEADEEQNQKFGEQMLANLQKAIEAKKLKRGDFAWLSVTSCRVME